MVTRSGEPSMVTPSHEAMALLPDQFSVPLPASVSRAASSASQSVTRPGLLAAVGYSVRAPAHRREFGEPVSPGVVGGRTFPLLCVLLQVVCNLHGRVRREPLAHQGRHAGHVGL